MKKFSKIFAVGLLAMSVLVGCSSSDGGSVGSGVSGNIVLNGSTSMEKLSNSFIEVYAEINPNINITAEFTGSSAGVESVSNGLADIGNASRALKDSELANGLVENIVAIDGIAIIVDPANSVTKLTTQQLIDIYDGTITNWSELGGDSMGIVVIGREAGSGTRGAFEEILGIEDVCVYAQELDSTGAVVGKVESIKGSIGYVSLDVLHGSTSQSVYIDGVEPTNDTIASGEYTLARPFVMATKGTIAEQNEAVQEFFSFIQSDEGREVVELVGLVNVQ